MQNGDYVHVFAYGSNLHTKRMRNRVPSAKPVASGYVNHRKLVFHKRSEDGSAKADAMLTPVATDRVWGVVYQLRREEKPALDQCEFLGVGYDHQRVNVVLQQGSLQAWMYVALRGAIDTTLLPYSWYLDYVIHGAYQHRLPRTYIDHLKSFKSLIDPDSARHAEHGWFIGG